MSTKTIALIGDYREAVLAHRCIPDALRLAGANDLGVTHTWIPTSELSRSPQVLQAFAAFWCVPGSPYANTESAFAAIKFARETGRPFLGTCGGFQHAVLEFARNVLALASAEHAETSPHGDCLVVTRLSCSLVDATGELNLAPSSRLRGIYGSDTAREGYRCNYGVNPDFRGAFEKKGLRFTAFDSAGEIRGFEYPSHPFFIGTLFQPERSAERREAHPLIQAFVREVAQTKS